MIQPVAINDPRWKFRVPYNYRLRNISEHDGWIEKELGEPYEDWAYMYDEEEERSYIYFTDYKKALHYALRWS